MVELAPGSISQISVLPCPRLQFPHSLLPSLFLAVLPTPFSLNGHLFLLLDYLYEGAIFVEYQRYGMWKYVNNDLWDLTSRTFGYFSHSLRTAITSKFAIASHLDVGIVSGKILFVSKIMPHCSYIRHVQTQYLHDINIIIIISLTV